MTQTERSHDRLKFLLRLAEEASPETIDGLDLATDVAQAIRERDRRIREAQLILDPLGIDVELGRRNGIKDPLRQGGGSFDDSGPIPEFAQTLAFDLCAEHAPRGREVNVRTTDRCTELIISTADEERTAAVHHFRCRKGDNQWWFGLTCRELEASDVLLFLLLDAAGELKYPVILPQAWLKENDLKLHPKDDSACIYVRVWPMGSEMFMQSRYSRHCITEWVNAWDCLWSGQSETGALADTRVVEEEDAHDLAEDPIRRVGASVVPDR
ncbi:MAG: hypothetical protein ACOX9R_02425 [Armatimonadota bacterium]|jgi:hypothetical protein